MLSEIDCHFDSFKLEFLKSTQVRRFLKSHFSSRTVKQTSGFISSDKNSEPTFLEMELPHAAELIKKLTSRVPGSWQAQMSL